jgi:type II secretory pathway pseudopilin PulG
MTRKSARSIRGFGLLEVLVLMGVLALVVVLTYPGYKRSGLMEKAQTVLTDLAQIELAVNRAGQALKAPVGAWLNFEQYAPHLPIGSQLQKTGLDPFGQAYGPQMIGSKPGVPVKAVQALQAVVPDGFWGDFPAGRDL